LAKHRVDNFEKVVMSQEALGGLAVAKTMLFAKSSGFDSQTQ
jgi:hypothetical protein